MVTTDHPWWARRVDWNFVYSHEPTHVAVAEAYRRQPPLPTILGEANYERENSQGNRPTTDETLRRQVAWARRLDSPGLADVGHVRDVFAGLWWRLVSDTGGDLLTGGRGRAATTEVPDVLDSDRATATIAPDGSQAVVYVPTARTITIDTSALAKGVQARWVDPSTGRSRPVDVQCSYRTPGENGDGDGDWLLVFEV